MQKNLPSKSELFFLKASADRSMVVIADQSEYKRIWTPGNVSPLPAA